ncbi:hypothetical protein T4E_8983, partial [Trichinella pseudospiralis]
LATSLAFRGLNDPSAMNQVLHTDWQAITLCFLGRLTNSQRLFFQRSTNRPPRTRPLLLQGYIIGSLELRSVQGSLMMVHWAGYSFTVTGR